MPAACCRSASHGGEAQVGPQNRAHLGRAQVAGHEDQRAREIHAAIVAEGQRGFVENAEQQVPQRVAGLLDLVEQDEAQLHLFGVILVQHFLAEQRMRLAMAQVSGRRADQLGDLVAVLKLRAVDLDHRAAVAHQALRRGFHQPRLAGAGRPQEQEVADRPSRARHARQIRLINVNDLLDRLVLADDSLAQIRVEFLRFETGLRRIQLFIKPPHNPSPPLDS